MVILVIQEIGQLMLLYC